MNPRTSILDDLDPPAWGPPTYSSNVVRECHRLRTVALSEMTPADLRIQVGQKLSLRWLVPIALDVVGVDPLCFADFYPGDLLRVLLEIPASFWEAHPEMKVRLVSVLRTMTSTPGELVEARREFEMLKMSS
ncbi:MAG: hypothetical protein ACI9VR_003286 [Cognaticolwellia sp.]|jgi:hypothetical protein